MPRQGRAVETVRDAIEATVELLDREPEKLVTIEAIQRRSGVSRGSLTHHFGSRDGLIAAAHVERYRRSCAADRAFLGKLDGVLTAPGTTITALVGMLDAMLEERRAAGRWLRLSAIAAAFADEELTVALSRIYTALVDDLTVVITEAHESGVLAPEADARTIALLLTMQAQGLVLDDVIGGEVDRSVWNHMQARFAAAFLTPTVGAQLVVAANRHSGDLWKVETLRHPCEPPHDVARRLVELRSRAAQQRVPQVDVASARMLLRTALRSGRADGPSDECARSDERAALLSSAMSSMRLHGQRGVDLTQLRANAGMSAQTFHRLFGTRDDLVREARVQLELDRSARAIARLSAIVAACSSAADMQRALLQGAVRIAEGEARTAMWQRIETIAATRTDPTLHAAISRIQRTTRDLVIEQLCLAQGHGLIDGSLPVTGVARLLEGSMFWHVFHGLDARRPSQETWTATLARVTALISPDG